jgi:hypothetical protein
VFDDLFADAFEDASLRGAWFQSILQLSFVGGLTDRYVDLTAAQHAALRMRSTDRRRRNALGPADGAYRHVAGHG